MEQLLKEYEYHIKLRRKRPHRDSEWSDYNAGLATGSNVMYFILKELERTGNYPKHYKNI